ncbi:MAG: ECF transporter S component [Clostridia bacterium]
MQAELSDKINENETLRQIARTALVVVLVCAAMPFLKIVTGEIAVSFSLWQFATSAFRYSDIGYQLPESLSSMLMVSRIFAWVVLICGALGLILLFNRNRSGGKDNSFWVMIFALIALILCFGLYFFVCYLLSAGGVSGEVSFDAGGLAMAAALAVTVLVLFVKCVKNRTVLAAVLIFAAIPLTILFGSLLLDNRKFYFISLLVIFETMLPFFLVFENRKPEARELVVIAVVAAIGVVGRAVFFMVPNMKPVTAIVIIAGACLGPEAGFLTGAMTAFVSNFFFGQGPWTPWQMFSFGIIGFLTGMLFRKGILKKEKKIRLCLYGAFVSLCIYGLLMDTYTVLTMDFVSSKAEVLAIYASGFPVNCVHAVGTFLFLMVLANPMIEKLERIRRKYGMIESGKEKKQ